MKRTKNVICYFFPCITNWRFGIAWGLWDYGIMKQVSIELGPLRWIITWKV